MITDLIGKLKNTKLPKTKPLLPLFEAISNSIHSLRQAEKPNGKIRIIIERETSQLDLDKENPIFPIKNFHIEDDGIGFNTKNYESFQTAETQYKSNIGGKGIGRFVWLKAFSSVKVSSVYEEGGKYYKREFEFLPKDDGIFNHKNEESTTHTVFTKVSLINFNPEYYKRSPKTIEPISRSIIDHFLIYFLLQNCPRIDLIDERDSTNLNKLYSSEIKAEAIDKLFEIKNKTFTLYLTKLFNTYWTYHSLHLCANQREVKNINLEKIIPDLCGKIKEDDKSFLYQVYVTSEYLDENVNSERTGFIFSDGNEDNLLPDEISEKDIHNNISNNLKVILEDYLSKIRAEKNERIQTFVNNDAPQYRPLIKYRPDLLEDIPANIGTEKLDVELFKRQSKFEVDIRVKREEIFKDKLEDITDIEQYRTKYETYVEEMNEIGKSKLAQYIIHRKSVIELLDYYLGLDDSKQFWKEDTIHKIVFPLKNTSDDISYDKQNLWLIDEKLAYHKYFASDIPFSQIEEIKTESDDRADLLIFNGRFALVNDDYPFQSIVIVEFKRPGLSRYTEKENPLDQVIRYIRTIRDGKAKDKRGSYIEIKKDNTPFYVYIICDITPRLKEIIKDKDFIETPDGLGHFRFHTNYNAYIEIISYKKLLKDAKDRNRILFEKLGI